MDTVGAMIAALLPPVGQPITRRQTSPPTTLGAYAIRYLQSGTAALALALAAAKRRHQESRASADSLEVLLPAYACPDLVSASIFAGLKPVLVDLAPDNCTMDLNHLVNRISNASVAIIAVNFLGIAEHLKELRALASQHQLALIEDDAQWMPEPFADTSLVGDYVIISFGRGKPVPLGGGGALLFRASESPYLASATSAPLAPQDGWFSAQLRSTLHNWVLSPAIFGLLARVPALRVGDTRYVELNSLEPANRQCIAWFDTNRQLHAQRSRHRETCIAQLLKDAPVLDLAQQAGARAGRLLRYPLLGRDRTHRDHLHQNLSAAGLGSSLMYQYPLNRISRACDLVSFDKVTNAQSFADRLLTLPVHEGVNEFHLERIHHALTMS